MAINHSGLTRRSEFTYDGQSRVAKILEKTCWTINSTGKNVLPGTDMVEVVTLIPEVLDTPPSQNSCALTAGS